MSNTLQYVYTKLALDDFKEEFKEELKTELMDEIRKELALNKVKEIAEKQSQAKWSTSPISLEVERININR